MPTCLLQALQLHLHLLPQLEIQCAQGFIQQQDAGVIDEGPRKGDPLALAAESCAGLR